MLKYRIENFFRGWIIGNFTPTLFQSEEVEVGVKFFNAGDIEGMHYQKKATEISVLMTGACRIGSLEMLPGDIAVIPPMESADFISHVESTLVVIKFPSEPNDKILGSPEDL